MVKKVYVHLMYQTNIMTRRKHILDSAYRGGLKTQRKVNKSFVKDRLNNISERKKEILDGRELSLGVEGRFTNIRIWVNNESIYMRLDRLNNYSAPLSIDSVNYLDKPNPIINELLKDYGFKSSIDNLDNILELTKKMKYRECREW